MFFAEDTKTRDHKMSIEKEKLLGKIAKLEKAGVALGGKTKEALNALENPHYTITFTGCFQVGKSTLLNRVVFGMDALLTEGNGLPTTAIPTKIVFGDKKELKVVYRDDAIAPQIYSEGEITEELLRKLTTADGEDARDALADKIRYIELSLPVEGIRNYTFFDTPGVDDPNQQLIERTTAVTLPTSDLVVLVVDAGSMLSTETQTFLKKSIFQQGMSRVMILASYKPQHFKSAAERKLILDTIRSSLIQMGRDYIPVYSYTYDETVDGEILHGPKEIMDCLLKFIDENKNQAKLEKLAFYLGNDLQTHVEGMKARLEVSGKSEQEIKDLDKKIQSSAITLDAEYQNLSNRVTGDYAAITKTSMQQLEKAFFNDSDSFFSRFLSYFNECGDLTSVKNNIPVAIGRITPDIQDTLATAGANAQKEIEKLLVSYSDVAAKAAVNISLSTVFVANINTGWMGKINPTLLRVVEVGGAFMFNVIAGIGVLVADRIPVIKNLLPHNFARQLVLSSIEKSFKESLQSAIDNFIQQLNASVDSVREGIRLAFEDIYRAKIAPYKEAIKKYKDEALNEAQIQEIRNGIQTLTQELNELGA